LPSFDAFLRGFWFRGRPHSRISPVRNGTSLAIGAFRSAHSLPFDVPLPHRPRLIGGLRSALAHCFRRWSPSQPLSTCQPPALSVSVFFSLSASYYLRSSSMCIRCALVLDQSRKYGTDAGRLVFLWLLPALDLWRRRRFTTFWSRICVRAETACSHSRGSAHFLPRLLLGNSRTTLRAAASGRSASAIRSYRVAPIRRVVKSSAKPPRPVEDSCAVRALRALAPPTRARRHASSAVARS